MFRTMQAVLVSFLVLLLSVIACAQGGVATGDLHVTVKDPKGNIITNAAVTVQELGISPGAIATISPHPWHSRAPPQS